MTKQMFHMKPLMHKQKRTATRTTLEQSVEKVLGGLNSFVKVLQNLNMKLAEILTLKVLILSVFA